MLQQPGRRATDDVTKNTETQKLNRRDTLQRTINLGGSDKKNEEQKKKKVKKSSGQRANFREIERASGRNDVRNRKWVKQVNGVGQPVFT